MAINVGGFFASLSLKSDKASFNESKKDMNELADGVKKTGEFFKSFTEGAVKGLLAIGSAALGSAYAVSQIQGKMEISATKAGMGYSEFNKLSSALKLVGLDSTNVATKMAAVNSALNDFKVGKNSEALAGLAKNLALMGIDLRTFAGLSPTQQIQLIAKQAESARGTDREVGMRDLADEIAGLGDALMAIQQKGSAYQNFSALMTAGASATWSSNQSDVTKNSQSFNNFKLQMDQMWKTAGESIGTSFRPVVDDLAKFVKDHKDEIKQFFTDVGEILKNLATSLGPLMKQLASFTGDFASEVASYTSVGEFKSKNPEAEKKLAGNLKKLGFKSHNPLANFWSDEASAETATFNQVEAIAIKLLSGAYSGATTEEERAKLGNAKANHIEFHGLTIQGTDFNKVVNFMSEHPTIDPSIIIQAAIAISGMANTQ